MERTHEDATHGALSLRSVNSRNWRGVAGLEGTEEQSEVVARLEIGE